MTTRARDASGRSGSGLVPALLFTWLNSLGTGGITNGVFFIADQRFGATPMQNYLLGASMGASYIAGALAIGPIRNALAARGSVISTRVLLVVISIALALSCALPLLQPEFWLLWLFAIIYLPISGTLWPIVESYVSGGRRGAPLRKAIGAFNLTWASAVAVAFWLMAPLLREHSLEAIAALGVVHVLCLPIVMSLSPEPPRHLHETPEPHPERYERLLPCFRMLLMLSYILASAINPMLPWRMNRIGVDIEWKMPLASAWGLSRIGAFLLFQWWRGWHGRWRTPIWTAGAMITGFVAAAVAPNAGVLVVGLALFGLGMGGVYYGALYYAMTVGFAEIDAGGRHEAAIGFGYALGPLCGAMGWGAASIGVVNQESAVVAMLAMEFVLIVIFLTLATTRARARKRLGSA